MPRGTRAVQDLSGLAFSRSTNSEDNAGASPWKAWDKLEVEDRVPGIPRRRSPANTHENPIVATANATAFRVENLAARLEVSPA
jgi:hypothetical protein